MKSGYIVYLIFAIASILRLSLVSPFYHGDLNNNISWGTLAVERGLNDFYDENQIWPYSAPNQPPLTIMMFAFLRMVWILIRDIIWYFNWEVLIFPSRLVWFWDDYGMRILIKLPSIIADLGIGLLIYKFLSKEKNKKSAIIFASVWLFNPIVWYNSTIWGQTDSVVNLLGLIGIFYLLKRNILRFVFFFTLSLLFKGSLAIFIPILFFVLIRQKYPIHLWLKSIVLSLVTVFVTSIWFHRKLDLFFWIIGLYQQRILPGEIGYLTANAFNFWWLIDHGKTLDSSVYLVFSARLWGFLIYFIGVVIVIFRFWKRFSSHMVLFSLVIVSFLSFLFLTRVHERYLYPFFPIATILLGLIKGLYLPYLILSFTFLLNMYHLFWVPSIRWLEAAFVNIAITNLLSLINILVFVYLLRHFLVSKL